MNYIQLLASFFDKASVDNRLNPTHVSMFVSIFQFWNINHYVNPISITRRELMKVSKINSKATYHKCMRELNEYGYLKYLPSYNSYKGSLIYFFNFQSGTELIIEPVYPTHTKMQSGTELFIEPVQNTYTKIQSGTELKNEHLIHNTVIHNTNTQALAQKKEVHFLSPSLEIQNNTEEKSCAKKENNENDEETFTPTLLQVNNYFKEQDYPEIESNKFFNYYQSVGWVVGGRIKMKDWKAASNNWILNIKNLAVLQSNKLKANHLHSPKNKKYNEPL